MLQYCLARTRNYPGSLHAIDAVSGHELNYELRYYILARDEQPHFLKLAIDQITSAAPAQNDAGGTVDE